MTSYAQHKEDDWVLSFFHPDYRGEAVDVGAHDGTELSNTRALEEYGWRVLAIEPNPEVAEALVKTRSLPMVCACDKEANLDGVLMVNRSYPISGTSLRPSYGVCDWPGAGPNWEPRHCLVLTLDQCLRLAGFSRLDLVSLDVEGMEMDVLDGFDLSYWRPRLMIVESVEPDSPVVGRLQQFGYVLAGRREYNNLMVLE